MTHCPDNSRLQLHNASSNLVAGSTIRTAQSIDDHIKRCRQRSASPPIRFPIARATRSRQLLTMHRKRQTQHKQQQQQLERASSRRAVQTEKSPFTLVSDRRNLPRNLVVVDLKYLAPLFPHAGRRDFIDHSTHVDPIDGVVLVDPDHIESIASGHRVFVSILAAFRYGREDLDVLGLTFRKDLHCDHRQVYPPLDSGGEKKTLSKLQERLLRKLGANAHPFCFQLPHGTSPASVTLQPAPGDTGKPCGVDYELKALVATGFDDKSSKRDVVRLAIRKLYYAPSDDKPREQPSTDVAKEFVMSSGRLHLESTLDKEMYYHGESIAVNVQITNNSSKTVKKIKVR